MEHNFKTCIVCNTSKTLSDFDQGRNKCKECRKIIRQAHHQKIKDNGLDKPRVSESTCQRCLETKPISNFEITSIGNPRTLCIQCRKTKRQNAFQHFVETATPKIPEHPPLEHVCVDCKKSHPDVTFPYRLFITKVSWRPRCTKCTSKHGQQYCKTYKERRRQEDEEGFRAHRTQVHAQWVKKNPDKMQQYNEQRRADVNKKFKTVLYSAKARNIYVNADDHALIKEMLVDACFYCGYQPVIGKELNGIDRVDASKGYHQDNIVTCCSTCNCMKNDHSIKDFIECVRGIGLFRNLCCIQGTQRIPIPPFSGNSERRYKIKSKAMNLTEQERVELQRGKCYLCGTMKAIGIDRIDSDKEYTKDNSAPCCRMCNFMKKDYPLDQFLEHVAYVNEHTKYWMFTPS